MAPVANEAAPMDLAAAANMEDQQEMAGTRLTSTCRFTRARIRSRTPLILAPAPVTLTSLARSGLERKVVMVAMVAEVVTEPGALLAPTEKMRLSILAAPMGGRAEKAAMAAMAAAVAMAAMAVTLSLSAPGKALTY